MAENEYVNIVQFGDQTIMDISDTTAEAGDVLEGATFYTRSGAPATGTLGDVTSTTHGLMTAADKNKLDSINIDEMYKTINTAAAIRNFTDGTDGLSVKQLVAEIKLAQDLHTYNQCTISRIGRNFINMSSSDITNGYVVEKYLDENGDETSPEVGEPQDDDTVLKVSNTTDCTILEYTKVWPNTTYTLSGITNEPLTYFVEYDASKNIIKTTSQDNVSITFTTTSTTEYIRVTKYKEANNIQLEIGEASTAYEAYTINEYEIDFPTNIYGGRITINNNGTGILSSEYVKIELTDKTFTQVQDKPGRFVLDLSTNELANAETEAGIICSHFTSSSTLEDTGSFVYISSGNEIIFQTGDSNDTIETFEDWLSAQDLAETPVTICYKLGISTNYLLSSVPTITLTNEANNIWCDTGDIISVTYPYIANNTITTAERYKLSQIEAGAQANPSTMVGATSIFDGEGGLVPTPTYQDYNKYLKGDGTWDMLQTDNWSGMTINKETAGIASTDVYVIGGEYLFSAERMQYKVSSTPAGNVIPKYDANAYLNANTPLVGDASNRVATTAFVNTTLDNLSEINIHRTINNAQKIITLENGYDQFPIQTITFDIKVEQNLNGYYNAWIGGTGKNLVDITTFTITETTTKTIGAFAAGTYSIGFNINNTTEVIGNIAIKADNTTLTSFVITASMNERKTHSFTLEAAATITLVIGSENSDYSYTFSNIQVESSATATTYAPYENICPITSGYTSCNVTKRQKNLWNYLIQVGQAGYYNETGTFVSAEGWKAFVFLCEENDTFTLYGTGFKDIITFWNGSTFVGYSQDNPVTIPSGVTSIRICGYNTTADNKVYQNEEIYQYNFPQAAGTVHGGYLTVNQDGTGILVSNYNIGDLGSLIWTYDSENNIFVADCFIDQKLPTQTRIAMSGNCSNLPITSIASLLIGQQGIGVTTDGKYYVYYKGMGTDATAFTTAMSGQKLYYETNAITYNLTDLPVITLFSGYNQIINNAGTTRALEYIANVNGLISTADKLKLNALDLTAQASVNSNVALKADKVTNATDGNFAALNSSGNLVDSGHKHSDYLTSHQSISHLAPKASPVFTTQITIGNTTLTEADLQSLLVLKNNIASMADIQAIIDAQG